MKAFEQPTMTIRAFELEDILTVSVVEPGKPNYPAGPIDPELPGDDFES